MKIAIVDDDIGDVRLLKNYLEQFQREHEMPIYVDCFHAGLDFLEEFRDGYDVIFLDIEMPGSDGLETAREIRQRDEAVGIIFVTNMAQYAIRGYEVNAIDFMVKPVRYFNFSRKLEKAMKAAEASQRRYFALKHENGITRILFSDILYIEKEKNYLIYHTRQGTFKERGTMQELKNRLSNPAFAVCSSGCMVNLNHVESVGRKSIVLDGLELPLSRGARKELTERYIELIGGML